LLLCTEVYDLYLLHALFNSRKVLFVFFSRIPLVAYGCALNTWDCFTFEKCVYPELVHETRTSWVGEVGSQGEALSRKRESESRAALSPAELIKALF